MGQHSNSIVPGAESVRVKIVEVHMLQRRTFISGSGYAAIAALASGLASSAWAQRVTNPIARRGGMLLVPGRFDSGGVASGALPGIYVVVAVDADAETLQLRDAGGRTGLVHVKEGIADLDSLKPGDEVEVDFLVPDPGGSKLEAGGLWKVQR
jgi:hypothetical protein